MVYTIKSKHPMNELVDALKDQELTVIQQPDRIEVETKDPSEHDMFVRVLAVYIVLQNVKPILYQSFVKKGIGKRKSERLTKEVYYRIQGSNYFSFITMILVNEYFRTLDTINLESFSMFNMKGFKEEVADIVKKIVEPVYDISDDVIEEEVTDTEDVFCALRESAASKGIDLKEYTEVHVLGGKERFIFKNKKGVVIDDDFFVDTFGHTLTFTSEENIDDKELIDDIFLFNCFFHIFNVQKIVVHKNLSQKQNNLLLHNIKILKDSYEKLCIVNCKGCKECENIIHENP